ncbi:DNA excision repair protein ERCC-5 [Sardina pilchardus]|uniref:DNA excision repair protein ERCC-5 n=1 Tax=Sardina pilchardus TaxID=27697 RepID=UPI002E0E255E
MGVHGLWKLLESTGKPINPETLEGKILAVDISIWLNQALKGVRDRDGNTVQNAHLLTLFHRLCKLLFFRIRPVFVFDGDAPLLKKQTLAIRRQRKEEMSKESKQTHEKMLRTFLKRHAIKAALGETSQEPVPSLSTGRRDEADDMYVLPALPAPVEKEDSLDEEEALDWEESTQTLNSWQESVYEDPGAVDINSEQFLQLPPEMKHEILKDMKEFAKRRRTMYQKPPEKAGDFSQYQLAGLLQRRHLNLRLEGVQQEMNQQSSAGLSLPEDSEHSVETRRLASEDASHYILIKGSEKSTKPAESQPAVTSVPLDHRGKPKGRRRDVLWTPITEESSEDERPSSPKPSVSDRPSSPKPSGSDRPSSPKPSGSDPNSSPRPPAPERPSTSGAQPPSPRTLKAIEAAMMGSSSEEEEAGAERDAPAGPWGHMSPRTLLAVQNAMLEPDRRGHGVSAACSDFPQCTSKEPRRVSAEPPLERSSVCTEKRHGSLSPHGGAVVISSSDEEQEDAGADDSHVSNGNKSVLPQHQRQRMGEEKGAPAVAAQQRGVVSTDASVLRIASDAGEKSSTSSDSESSELESTTPSKSLQHVSVSTEQTTPEENPGKPKPTTPEENPGKPSSLSKVPLGNGQGVEFEEKERRPSQDDVKSETSDEGSTEENFIDVSEGEEGSEELPSDESELKPDVSLSAADQPEDVVHEEETDETEEGTAEEPEEGPSQESEEEEEEKGLSATPVDKEWDHIDLTELRQLESSLEQEQQHLRGQQQQQERVAASVTGQMCQESQELLRLFGIPFLVAPMEAEAQCAALDRADLTHGTITDDSDIWLFGGRHVFKNFFSQNKYVEHYQFVDLQNQLGLDRSKLINLAYLLGSDYTEGIPGVGYVTGMEILNEFPGPAMESLIQFSKWWAEAQQNKKLVSNPKDTKVKRKLRGLQLHPGFPNPAVAQAYLQPAVDPSEGSFSWGRPHLDLIKEFCQDRFGWTRRKTEETLQPVLKQLNSQQTQLRIDSFFRLEQQERQSIQSQRLRRAVTCMKRKERGEEDEDHHDEDEEQRKDTRKGRAGRSGRTQEPVSRPVGEEEEAAVVVTERKRDAPAREKKVDTPKSAPKRSARDTVRRPDHSSSATESKSDAPAREKKVDTPKTAPKRSAREAVQLDSSSSSSSDTDSGSGQAVAMVTARSVFTSKPQKRGRRGGRGRSRTAH